MERNILISFTILSLLSMVLLMGLSFNIQTAKASGTIYIRADGNIDPPTANITTANNVTYYFTGNNYDEIVVERSNIVIDGDGFMVQGSGSGRGIDLTSISNVTVKNTNVENFRYGFFLNLTSQNIISGNNLTNNDFCVYVHNSSKNSIVKNNLRANKRHGIIVASYSSNNSVSGNNITNNDCGIVHYGTSCNNSISGNYIAENKYGIMLSGSSNVLRNNSMIHNKYNFEVVTYRFVHDVDPSNTVDGKPIYYWVNRRNLTVPFDAGYVALINCSNIMIKNLNVTKNRDGLLLAYTTSTTITNSSIVENGNGIYLFHSSNNSINRNNITESDRSGIWLWSSNNTSINGNNLVKNNGEGIHLYYHSNHNTIGENNITESVDGISLYNHPGHNSINRNKVTGCSHYGIHIHQFSNNNTLNENDISRNEYGIDLSHSSNNSIVRNRVTENRYGVSIGSYTNRISKNSIANNLYGIQLSGGASNNTVSQNNITNNNSGIWLNYAWNNSIHHNNFINNDLQAHFYTHRFAHFWDDGYPSGGNYWSNYAGVDSDHDGIGDTIHVLDENNLDHYPLMGMFSDFNATSEYAVQTICNSTISAFQFNGTAICFNVTGEDGTVGFCRTCIPTALLDGTYRVFVNGTEVSHTLLPCSNSTHSYLYFTYTHSIQEVVIIPEFPSFLVLPLFMIATLLAATLYRRKHSM